MRRKKTIDSGNAGTRINRNYTVTFATTIAVPAGAQRIQFGAKGWIKGWMGAQYDPAAPDPTNITWTVRRSHNANFPIDDIAVIARNVLGNGQRPFWLPRSEWIRVRDGSTVNVAVLDMTGAIGSRIDVTAIVSEDVTQPKVDQGEDR